MGETPERVFLVGELGVENCLHVPALSLTELQKRINFDIKHKPYSIVTFHAATLEKGTAKAQACELIKALDNFPDMNFIITKANADAGGRAINSVWDRQKKRHPNWLVVPSLGVKQYVSAMKYAQMIIGNSSSGIIEAPAVKIPTVNIGERQKGRIMADSVICCASAAKDITDAIKRALSPEFRDVAANVINPLGEGNASRLIHEEIKKFLAEGAGGIRKEFYDG